MNQFLLQHLDTWKCYKETPWVAILHKQKCHFFSFIKSETRRAEQVLPEGVGVSGRWEKVEICMGG
jgi:hypothetical protein